MRDPVVEALLAENPALRDTPIIKELLAENEKLDDAIRDMLDFTVGWCRPMTDVEKLAAIRSIGEKVLSERPGEN